MLFSVLIALAIVGFLLWVITTYVPMPEPFKRLIVLVAIVVVLIWLARLAGVF